MLFALVFAVIDFGLALNDTVAVRQGAREGARQAITGRVGSDTSCTPVPSAPNVTTENLVCLVKDRLDLPEGRVRVKIIVESPYVEGKGIQICAMARLESITGFFGPILDDTVTQSAVQMRVEQTTDQAAGSNVADLQSFAETPLPGGSTWQCTLESAG